MRFSTFIYTVLLLLTMQACTESGADAPDAPDGGKIRLSAAVGSLENRSRAETDPGTDPTPASNPYRADTYLGSPSEANKLKAALWFRVKADGTYKNAPAENPELQLPVHTAMEFWRPEKEFVSYNNASLKYPTDDNPVYCVGLYPNDEGKEDAEGNPAGWTPGSDNLTALHSIDGVTDLMFAPEIEGTWTTPYANPLQFEHLLTWVKIDVCATSHDTAEAWGAIEQIEIKSRSRVAVNLKEIDLKTVQPEYTPDAPDKFIPTMSAPHELTTTMHEIGSVLVSPETAYTLRIKTKNNPDQWIEQTLELDLIKNGDNGETLEPVNDPAEARGKCFVLSLYFHPYKVVEAVCILNSWNNQSEDIYLEEQK